MAAVGSRGRRRKASNLHLHAALADPMHRGTAVPEALLLLEREPLASAGYFAGDLLRRLMELPPSFWGREPALYQRYREVVRAAASARRRMPASVRCAFWQDLPGVELGK